MRESLRLLGTQRLLRVSSLFDSHPLAVYLSISLPATQLLSLGDEHSHDHTYICTQAFPCAHSPFRLPQMHTHGTQRHAESFTHTHSALSKHTHTHTPPLAAVNWSLPYSAILRNSSYNSRIRMKHVLKKNPTDAHVEGNKRKEKLDY